MANWCRHTIMIEEEEFYHRHPYREDKEMLKFLSMRNPGIPVWALLDEPLAGWAGMVAYLDGREIFYCQYNYECDHNQVPEHTLYPIPEGAMEEFTILTTKHDPCKSEHKQYTREEWEEIHKKLDMFAHPEKYKAYFDEKLQERINTYRAMKDEG